MAFSKLYWIKPPLGTLVNRSHMLADGLLGSWIFNEGAGWFTNDSSGRGHRGRFDYNVGHLPSWRGTPFGPGLYWPNSDEHHIDCEDAADFDVTDRITMMALIMPTAIGGTTAIKGDAGVAISWLHRCGDSQMAQFTSGICSGGATIPTDRYSLVGFTFNGGTAKLYYNGKQDGSDSTGCSITANDLPFTIGLDSGATNGFRGYMAAIWFWNRVLPAYQIRHLYLRPFEMYGRNKGGGKTVAAPPAEPKPITIETRTAGPRKYQHHVFE